MFCPNCGIEIKDPEVFCPNCGTRLPQEAPKPLQKKVKKKHGKGKIAVVAVILLVAVLAVFFVYKQRIATELNKLTRGGYDGEEVAAPTSTPIPSPTFTPTPTPIPSPTPVPTSAPVASPTPVPAGETAQTDTSAAAVNAETGPALQSDFYKNGQVTGTDPNFIIPDSLSRELTYADIANLSAKGLSYARNEMMARMGRGFKNQELANYFRSTSWYQETISPEAFDAQGLPAIVSANASLMLEEEKKLNGGQLYIS